MHGVADTLAELDTLAATHANPGCDIVICPPATLISRAADRAGPIRIGAQDCHAGESGAHTGDISAGMILDAGGSAVILGHSERRTDHGEIDAQVRAKVQAGLAKGLEAIVCIGESLTQREAGETLNVVTTQLTGSLPDQINPDHITIAYEPVWAIGTGKVPTLDQIAEVHNAIRAQLSARFGAAAADMIPLLYGGSVKPGNATEIFGVENVDGALVGGASLKAADFSQIITALEAST